MTLQKVNQISTKILLKALHTKLFHIVLLVILLTIGNTTVFSQETPILTSVTLTKPVIEPAKDSSIVDSIKKTKTFLEGIVKMKAKEYEKIDQKKKTVTLNDEAEIYYTDFELKAGRIVLDYEKNFGLCWKIKRFCWKLYTTTYF